MAVEGQRLTKEEQGHIFNKVREYLPKHFHTETQQFLEEIDYTHDFKLVTDLLAVLNGWLRYDGIEGELEVTPYGLEIDFGLEHPIIVHIEKYGWHARGIDRTYLIDIKTFPTLYTKTEEILRVFCDYYSWLNPMALSYQINRTYGDENILVTLQDPRIAQYQDHIREQFSQAKQQNNEIQDYELTFAHNTRSVYCDMLLKNKDKIRLTVRDHDLVYEDAESIYVIYAFTLYPKRIIEQINEIIQTHVNNTTKA